MANGSPTVRFSGQTYPSWGGSCECPALSPVAGACRWSLLLLSPLLSAEPRPRDAAVSDVIDRSAYDLTHVSVVSDYFPCVDLASREHGMHQLAQGRLLSRSQHRSPRGYGFERLNKPVERPLRVFEAINQDRALTGEATPCELRAVGYGTSVIGVRGKDLLDGCVFVCAIISSQPRKLDLDGPVRDSPEGQVADVAAARITALSRIRNASCRLPASRRRSSPPLRPRRTGRFLAGKAWPHRGGWPLAGGDDRRFHGEGEVTNDLAEIHNPEATALAGPRLLNPWIKRQAQPCSKPSEFVRSFDLAWPFGLRPVRRGPTPCDGRCCLSRAASSSRTSGAAGHLAVVPVSSVCWRSCWLAVVRARCCTSVLYGMPD